MYYFIFFQEWLKCFAKISGGVAVIKKRPRRSFLLADLPNYVITLLAMAISGCFVVTISLGLFIKFLLTWSLYCYKTAIVARSLQLNAIANR